MTLVLSLAAANHVIQVADRLVTKQVGASFEEFDPISNKTVVYIARDGMASMSYSGDAYLAGMPTDQWIAELLWGERNPEFPEIGGMHSMVSGKAPKSRNLDAAVESLRLELSRVYPHKPLRLFEIDIVGWRCKRDPRRARPIHVRITNRPSQFLLATFTSNSTQPRHWYAETMRTASGEFLAQTFLDSIGQPFDDADRVRIRERVVPDATPRDVAGAMVEAIVRLSRGNAAVGDKCLVVYMPHPRYRAIEIASVSATPIMAEFSDGFRYREALAVGITPWVVSPVGLVVPSTLVGSSRHEFGPITVQLRAPASTSKSLGYYMSTVARPDLEGRRRPPLQWPGPMPPVPGPDVLPAGD